MLDGALPRAPSMQSGRPDLQLTRSLTIARRLSCRLHCASCAFTAGERPHDSFHEDDGIWAVSARVGAAAAVVRR